MQEIKVSQITEKLQKLSSEKLLVAYDFISYLLDQETEQIALGSSSEAYQTMLATEAKLREDWERAEEEEAWANL